MFASCTAPGCGACDQGRDTDGRRTAEWRAITRLRDRRLYRAARVRRV